MAEPTLRDVLSAIVTLTGAVGRLEKGQAALEKRQEAIEKGQAALEKRQEAIEKGQAAIEKGQAALEKGQAAIEKGQAALEKGQAALEKGQAALEKGQAALEKGQREIRAETAERFDALDKKLDTFRGVVASGREDARELRADVSALHKGLVRAKIPGIPKDLPSQVRAKGERPGTPGARPARRRSPR